MPTTLSRVPTFGMQQRSDHPDFYIRDKQDRPATTTLHRHEYFQIQINLGGDTVQHIGGTIRPFARRTLAFILPHRLHMIPHPDDGNFVVVNGVGTDAVDLPYARSRGIHVTATLGALTDDVADLAIGLLIAVCRGLCTGDRLVRSGGWASSATPLARKFSGMRIGIVGMGRVGRAVATRAAAFGCPVSYTDLGPIDGVPYQYVDSLLQLASDSDALILAAADKAEGIVNAAVLDALGPQGFLVNIARGRLVNEADLVSALSAGRIAGAGLDVFADEPHVPAALLAMECVALQPHRASATLETRTAMGKMVLASLAQALAGFKPESSLTT